ncbi:MAG: nitroreductase family protein [Candidatus Hermodarchaeota archaeon]
MSFYNIMMKRRSVRSFKDQKIPQQIIDELTDVANNAPSGGNFQPLSIIIIQDDESRKQLSKFLDGQPWVQNAPLSLIFCIDFNRMKKWASMSNTVFLGDNAFIQFLVAYTDVICAAQNVVILAESYGLGSIYVGTILGKINKVRKYFTVPKYVLPIISLSIGYPERIPENICKINKSVIIHKEKYENMNETDIIAAYNNKYEAFNVNIDEFFQEAYVEALEYDKQLNGNMVKRVKERIEKFSVKNPAQFLFNLRYPSKAMVAMNKKLFRELKEAGFEFI